MAHAEFNILGTVGKVTTIGEVMKVRVAAEYGRRDPNSGDFNKNTFWNEITVFNEKTINWAQENLNPGDVVHVQGTIKQTSWDKDGETRYDVLLAARKLDRIVSKAQLDK